ncbi:NADH dehydrogenase [Bradyrhizobium sp. GM22.5]
MARIVVLGAGFAGLWAAIGAARKREEIGAAGGDIEIRVIDRNPYHNIRVRNYEADLSEVALPLPQLLDPIGVSHGIGEVEAIDPVRREISLVTDGGDETLAYDRLVLALGSEVMRPDIPGLAEHAFDVDTYAAALRLEDHLNSLGRSAPSPGRSTIVVVGAGFTGIEVAAEMPDRLARAGITGSRRIILVDPNPVVGATIGAHARPVIATALASLDVETRLGVRVVSVEAAGLRLSSGEFIPTRTVIWCAGMRASPLAASFPDARDRLGRLLVDPRMRVADAGGVFAAGDVASSVVDGLHPTVMSCQFARPMGRFAGPQCGRRSRGPADAVAADRLVRDRARSRRLGRTLYGRVGPRSPRHRRGREGNQADDQPQAHLSAVVGQQGRAIRCGSPNRAGAAADVWGAVVSVPVAG